MVERLKKLERRNSLQHAKDADGDANGIERHTKSARDVTGGRKTEINEMLLLGQRGQAAIGVRTQVASPYEG
jgi:hypothetical protein